MWILQLVGNNEANALLLSMFVSHKAENAPLFGTGKLPSRDEDDGDDDEELQKPFIEEKMSSKYGSMDNDEEETAEPTVVSTGSNAFSKQSKKKVTKVALTETGKPEIPRRSCVLASFHFVEGFGVVTCLCLMATQVMPIIVIPLSEIGVMSLVLKIYVSVFCVLFILVEWDVPFPFLKNATFLQTYISRGFLYSFIALSSLEEAYSERVKDMVAHARDQFHVAWFSLFMQVSSWMMLSLGVLYMLVGVCCMKQLRDKLVRQDRERWAAYREAMKVWRRENP